MKEVTFEFDSIGTYELMDSGKVFPEVETLNIKKWGRTLRIPNGMFPNVTKVKTDKYGSYYKSGCMLVNDKGVLQNTFHPDSDVIDLKGVSVIDNGSFAGCQATIIEPTIKAPPAGTGIFSIAEPLNACFLHCLTLPEFMNLVA